MHVLDSDPEVMRYLTGRARTAEEIDAFWGPRCGDAEAQRSGLGWWVGFGAEGFIGWWDLGRSDSLPGTPVEVGRAEIGWRLRRSCWRQGLASEGAAALLSHAFETVGLITVYAETMAVNQGSRGVMRKLGMRHVRTYHAVWEDPLPGTEHGEVVYEITAKDWRHADRSSNT